MLQIIEREWKGLLIGQQKHNGYISATQLAKAYFQATGNRKDPSNWLANKRTKESIAYLATVTGIPVTELVIVNQGNFTKEEQGTWVHPDLSVNFAVWLSVELEFVVFGWVKDWLKGELNPQVKAIAPELEVARQGKSEERLCNGTNRPILLYPDSQQVRDAVTSFFG